MKPFIDWLAHGERGISSNTIATHLSGVDCLGSSRAFSMHHPLDPADFIRCQKLLEQVPFFHQNLSNMREVSPEWSVLVENWDKIANQLAEDIKETNGERAPKTFKLMKELERSVRKDNCAV